MIEALAWIVYVVGVSLLFWLFMRKGTNGRKEG